MVHISNVAVIGAGVMGAGIASLLASAGLAVTLLDLDPEAAAKAVSRQSVLGNFTDPAAAGRVQTGSSVSDLGMVADADWIIEAATERLETKRRIFASINAIRKPGSIISSNTSTIRLAQLVEGMAESDAQDFLITHFFNPPRRMRLLELVSGPKTRTEATGSIATIAGEQLGRCVVRCRDTPGFIANRIGNFWMAVAIHEAVARGVSVEDADAVLGEPFGTPAGIFGLLDLVGIDLLPSGWGSLKSALGPGDAFQAYPSEPPLIAAMIAQGRLGRKAGAGFYRRLADGQIETLDLEQRAYRPGRTSSLPALAATAGDPRRLMSLDDPVGRFAAAVMGRTISYAASLVGEIADEPEQIDEAMREGYGWRRGPFELIGGLGVPWLADRLVAWDIPVAPWIAKRSMPGAAPADRQISTYSGETM